MVFSSLVFLCAFLPITYLAYVLSPSLRVKNAVLIVASLLFYAYGEVRFLPIMLASILVNWLLGRGIAASSGGVRKSLLALAVVSNLLFIGVFKYASMFVSTLNALSGASIPDPGIGLPLGISFFTFQALSYVIDVYRGEVSGEDSLPKVLLFISFFPQIIAGPIIKYHDIEGQIDARTLDMSEAARGLRRFCYGMGKKVLISNVMAGVADALYGAEPSLLVSASAWLAAIAYLLQIYFDFSAYSDMAIGLGHMFGFSIHENFDYPYASSSIKEFWRRWHISLSTWFKEYLYIPLGGNRKGPLRAGVNKAIVFFCCGLWHGASWTFVVWGLIHGAFSLLEEVVSVKRLPKLVRHVYVLFVVTLAFVIFRADTLSQGIAMIQSMFAFRAPSNQGYLLLMAQLTPTFIAALVAAIIGAAPFVPMLRERASASKMRLPLELVSYALALVVLAASVLELSGGTYNPFIYFRF